MALIFADRVKETSSTTGTGTLTLAGAVLGFEAFASAIGNTNTVHYCITDNTDWEVGIGTVSSVGSPIVNTLSRDTVYASSNADVAVNWGAGTRYVFATHSASDITSILRSGDIGVTVQGYDAVNKQNIPARNKVQNQDPLSQGTSTRSGMSSTIYTGNGTSQSIATGIDMATGDFGGLVWLKSRTTAFGHNLYDTLRGAGELLQTNTTDVETTEPTYVTSFDTTGFSIGSGIGINSNLDDVVAWSFQTTKKKEPTYGSELITNGTFDTDTSGWTAGEAGGGAGISTLSIDTNRLKITNHSSISGQGSASQQLTGLTVGKTYEVYIDWTAGTATDAYGWISDDQTFGNNIGVVQLTTLNHFSFIATATTTYLYINNNSSALSIYSFFDNITIKQITNDAITNRGKPYTCHYNPDMNFSIVGYEGDGVDGHEIPHHLGVVPELNIFKVRDGTGTEPWAVKSTLYQGQIVYLDRTDALATSTTTNYTPSDSTVAVGSNNVLNFNTKNIISYHFASKSGVCKIGKYIGTGANGNYVSTEVDGGDAFKPAFVMIKNLTSIEGWHLLDSMRDSNILVPNVSASEFVGTYYSFSDNGFTLLDNDVSDYNRNELNDEYIFIAFAETSIDATKAITNYDYATTPDTLSIANATLISVANGFDANGQVDTQYQFGSGITKAYGAGHEDKHYYLYTSKLGVLGEAEVRPLIGITRNDADKYGEISPSDKTLRTTSKHFDYESDSGIALASSDDGASVAAFYAFDKTGSATSSVWQSLAGNTTGWLQYKQTEKRILKSWRFLEHSIATRTPKRFTIEGSNDGLNWTAIDSTYTASDYIGNGAYLWGDLQSTSGNTTAYLYHRINITANNGDATYLAIAELELNTIIASDYYLVEEGKMYNSTGVPIERVYLGEFRTDSAGDPINETIINYPVAGQEFSDVQVHGDLTVHGEANHRAFATAWVNFDGTQDPPLILNSFNVKDIVDLGTGQYRIIFETPMDIISYIVSTSATDTANAHNVHESVTLQTKHSVDVAHYEGSTPATVDSVELSVIIFGGKKI